MFCKLSKVNDLFQCFKLPVTIFDANASALGKYNSSKDSQNTINNCTIINDIYLDTFKPGIQSFKYDYFRFTCISFYNCFKTQLYLLIGPYKLSSDPVINKPNIIEINDLSLNHTIRLYHNLLNCDFNCNCSEKSFSPLVKGSIEYIERNYDSTITIDNICAIFNVNKCYFCNTFKKETGLTFINYLNKFKIEKSKELLSDLSLSLLDISLAVGFNNQSYFSTIFKKFTDITPMEYRASIFSKNIN